MDNTDYITILGWMKRLQVSLVEKMVFSIIYGFSKDRRSDFRGSRQYLADWCECSTKTIDRALASLCASGYIIKREEVVEDVKFCHYQVNFALLDKMSIPRTICPEGCDNLSKTEDKMSHNIIVDNGDTIVSPNRENRGRALEEDDDPFAMPPFDEVEDPTPSPKPSPSPKTATRFTPPTLEDVAAYCRERGNKIDPQHFVNYYTSNGWMVGKNKMKDWRAAVRHWDTRDKERNNGKRNIDPGSPAAYRQVGRGDYYGESTI